MVQVPATDDPSSCTDQPDHAGLLFLQGNHQAKSATTIDPTGSPTPKAICPFWLNPEPVTSLLLFAGEELADVESEVVVALSEEVVICSGVPPDEGVVGVPTATGMLDEPAETVDVAVAVAPPATWSHAKMTAGTPSGPSK